ncbi:type II toxin-antitoxin system PemK/MazF family toxin [Xanthobacter autotrophicus DSM 431]|uniref:type II toxin-antitoxin system PemK/MazF family toxin n=1 Tax=Xanthobacter nonsaccharivorans TaxID=3119912 RepID=UPI003729F055
MPTFEKGAVVRVPFPYTDRSTLQHRPTLVVSPGGVGEAAELLWVVMITSAENRPWPGNVPLEADYRQTGLSAPSVIRPCKITTIEARLAEPIGAMSPAALRKVDAEVRRLRGFA